MQPIIRYAILALLSLLVGSALAQVDSATTFGLEAGEHAVGFRLIEEQDRSRVVSGGSSRRDASAADSNLSVVSGADVRAAAQPLRFGRYAALADDDVWPAEIAGELRDAAQVREWTARAFAEPAPSFEALLARPMRAVENAEPVRRPVPAARDRPRPLLRITGHVRRDGRVSGRPRLRRGDGAARRHAHRDREAQRAGSRNADSRSRVRHRACAAIPVRRSGAARRPRLRPGRHGRRRARDAQSRRRRVRQPGLGHSISARVGTAALVAALRRARTARPLAARRQSSGRAAARRRAISLFDEAVHSDRYWLRVAATGSRGFHELRARRRPRRGGGLLGRGDTGPCCRRIAPSRNTSGISSRSPHCECRQHGAPRPSPARAAAGHRHDARASRGLRRRRSATTSSSARS